MWLGIVRLHLFDFFYHRNASSFRDENKMHHLPDAVGDDFRQAFVNERFVANNITDER